MAEEQKPVEYTNYPKFSIHANQHVQGKRQTMQFGARDNNPRFTVFTGDPADTVNKGIIYAPFSPEVFHIFLNSFEEIIKGPNDVKAKIDSRTYGKKEDGSTDFTIKIVVSELWYGKDEHGFCWMSVTAPNRPRIKFVLKVSDFHCLFKPSGEQFTEIEASVLQAQATIDGLREAVYNMTSGSKTTYVSGAGRAASTKTTQYQQKGAAIGDDFGSDMPF